MKESKFKNIIAIVSLLFFISSGMSAMNFVTACSSDICCQSDCCEIETASDKISLSSENSCCNIVEGIHSKPQSSTVYVTPSKLNSSIIFSYTGNFSNAPSHQFYPQEYSAKPPILYNFISVLRI